MPVDGGVFDRLEAVQKASELKSDLILLDIGVLREAFNASAQGHFVKINAGGDLLTSVEAIPLGKTFVSTTMGKR